MSDPLIQEGLAKLQSDPSLGFVKLIVTPGDASKTPRSGQTMTMHYTGTLPNGTKFDSSRDKGRTFSFALGQGRVIKAWDLGVAQMCKGERAFLVCAASHAYGPAGIPGVIPPNSPLVFDVELIDFE